MSYYIETTTQSRRSLANESYKDAICSDKINLSELTEILRDYSSVSTNIIESAKLFELITNNSTDLIIIYKYDFSIKYISPSVKTLLGYEAFEIVGKKPDEIFMASELIRVDELQIMEYKHKSKQEKIVLESLIKPVTVNGILDCYLGISRDVAIRENIKNKLEHALEKEKAINETHSKFLSMASHELKSPLATISTSIELLYTYLQDDEHLKKVLLEMHINRINLQLERLNGIIDEVLFVEKNKVQDSEVKLEKLNLVAFIENLLQESFTEYYPSRITINSAATALYLNSNKILLYHIFKNLIENAIKYSKPDELKIQISIETTDLHIHVSVKDNGIGISPQDQNKLFDHFYRSSNVGEIGGFGIGLTIVQECAAILNSTVRFKSVVDEGSTFTVGLLK